MTLAFVTSILWGFTAGVLALLATLGVERLRMRSRLARVGLAQKEQEGQRLSFEPRQFAAYLGGRLARMAPRQASRLNTLVDAAGLSGRITAAELLGWKALGLFFGLVFGLLMTIAGGLLGLVVLLIGTGVGWFGSDIWLSRKRQARRRDVYVLLPTAVDVLSLALEAGMGLDQALELTSKRLESALGEEFQRVLLDVQLGFSHGQAFKRMAERTGLDEIRQLGIAVAQSEELGTPIVEIIRHQSRQVRVSRRRHAEAEALRAPVKMMFPMVLFILPALFMVVLGPAGLQVMKAMTR